MRKNRRYDARSVKEMQETMPQEEDKQESLTFWQVMSSTVAAAFGVQKSKNRERDFARGKPLHFIIAGLIFTVLFVLAVVGVVQLVLSNT